MLLTAHLVPLHQHLVPSGMLALRCSHHVIVQICIASHDADPPLLLWIGTRFRIGWFAAGVYPDAEAAGNRTFGFLQQGFEPAAGAEGGLGSPGRAADGILR